MAGLTRVRRTVADLTEIFMTSVRGMMEYPARSGDVFHVTGYHEGTNYGGGLFKFRGNLAHSMHDGGRYISPLAVMPSDWNEESQRNAWYNPIGLSGYGVFERIDFDTNLITNFGARMDYSVNANTILNKMSNIGLPIKVPMGKLKVEGMTRDIPEGGNINMTSMIIYGVPTHGGTDQTYGWENGSVIQGEGDLFLDVVNTVMHNILVRNTPGTTKGKLFTLGAYAQGEFSNCIFGPSNYHFFNPGFGIVGYNVKPYYRNCRFYGAEIWSRYFEGTVAGYHEQDCYTSHNKRGVFFSAPVSSCISDCIYEYNDERAIHCKLYGYNSASYQLSITGTFFETNGAGDTSDYKDRSNSHILIESVKVEGSNEPDAAAADMRLILDNVSFVDLNDNNPAFGAVCIDSKTTMISRRAVRLEPHLAGKQKVLTGSESFYVDPVGRYGDGKTSVNSLDFDFRAQHIKSGETSNFFRHSGSTLNLTNSGISSVFGTVVQTASVSLLLSSVPGVVVNGDLFVTMSGAGGYAAYKYRVTGTSDNKVVTQIDSKEVGGFSGAVVTFGDPTNFYLNVQNNGNTANITIAFVGTAQ